MLNLKRNERHIEILAYMNEHRFDTVENLAKEFNVSDRTIRYDIEALSCSLPIYTMCGRHGGGVYMVEGEYANQGYFSSKHTSFLQRIMEMLNPEDKAIMQIILKIFAYSGVRLC